MILAIVFLGAGVIVLFIQGAEVTKERDDLRRELRDAQYRLADAENMLEDAFLEVALSRLEGVTEADKKRVRGEAKRSHTQRMRVEIFER